MDRDSDLSRRRFIGGAGAVAGAAALGGVGAAGALAGTTGGRAPHPKTPAGALRGLQAGNKRHREGKLALRDYSPVGEKRASEQKPFAAIITCADSRISPELVFDVERGNIFVSRIAGNSVDSGTLGSTEYAVGVLGEDVWARERGMMKVATTEAQEAVIDRAVRTAAELGVPEEAVPLSREEVARRDAAAANNTETELVGATR